jgi:hypothetical protein
MHRVFPPLCFLLALAMLIAAFTLMSVDAPSMDADLHQAYATNDTARQEVLEASLKRRRMARKLLIGSLFAGAGIMTIVAFLTMVPSDAP